MDGKRERRFYQRLETLEDRLTFIGENFPGIDELIGNRILRKALYKEFQELTEALGDISAMMAKEKGILVKDDYSNLERLKTLLAPDVIENLKRANGLRNVLVNEYNGVDDTLAFDSVQEVLPSFKVFGSMVREWLKNR